MSRRVLVTGGAGFIGSHVAEAYLAAGDRVWVVDNLSSGRRENVPRAAEFVEMSVGDVALDALFRSVGGFDIVNHHAAQVDVRKSVADPKADAAVNIEGLLNVLECARGHGTRRVVFISSGGVVYGETSTIPTPETAPKAPESPYGVAKLAAEYYLQYYLRVQGLQYVALRYANVYGPRQDPRGEAGVVAIFCQRLLAGETLTIFGDGEQTRDYVYVGDVVAANMLLSEADLTSLQTMDERAYNVGTGLETPVNALAEALMQAEGRRAEVKHAPERKGELKRSCLDASRLRQLGWAPKTSLPLGLQQTYRYIAGLVEGESVEERRTPVQS